MDSAKPSSAGRRTFLKAAAITAGSTSTLAAVSAAPVKKTVSPPATDAEPSSTGYRETAHVRAYYKTLRE